MDAKEHERLSNITLKTQIKVKEQRFHCCSTFHMHFEICNICAIDLSHVHFSF
jgi:hypothetical protein